MYVKAERGYDVLQEIAENGGWDSPEELAEELDTTLQSLKSLYFETEGETEITQDELGRKFVTDVESVYQIHKGSLEEVFHGPCYVSKDGNTIYFDYDNHE